MRKVRKIWGTFGYITIKNVAVLPTARVLSIEIVLPHLNYDVIG